MSVDLPELVTETLDGESVLARVSLGGEDAAVVTPSRTLLYRADGLLSDESVTGYDHDVERLELKSGRRKATFRLGYVDRTEEFTVPSKSVNEVLVAVMEGLLRHDGLLDDGEMVVGAYRFSELTLVVTDRRALKHVGGTVWDTEFDEAPFDDLTGLRFDEGSVGTEIVLEVDGYPQRFKIPNEHAGTVRKVLQDSVFAFHGVDSLAELEELLGDDREERTPAEAFEESGFTDLIGDSGEGAGPEDAGEVETQTTSSAGDGSPGGSSELDGVTADVDSSAATDAESGQRSDETAGSSAPAESDEIAALAEEVAELRAAVESQSQRLERQGELIEQLVEELRQGR